MAVQDERKFAAVEAVADGDNTIVAAITGKRIIVLGYMLTWRQAGLLVVRSGAATVLSRLDKGALADASYVGDMGNPAFQTEAGAALVMNVPAAVDVVGHLTYIEG